MKSLTIVFCLLFAGWLPGSAMAEPTSSSSPKMSKTEAKEVAEMEKRLARAIAKKDVGDLEKILRDDYYDVYEGDKRAMSKRVAIARCQAGQLRYLEILRDSKTKPERDFIVVEGDAKLIPNRQDDIVPAEQWVHIRRFWKKTDGKWLLASQIRRLEGDDGQGEVD